MEKKLIGNITICAYNVHTYCYLEISSHPELQQFKNRLDILSDKVENISAAIEENQQYSYCYNVKLMGTGQKLKQICF